MEKPNAHANRSRNISSIADIYNDVSLNRKTVVETIKQEASPRSWRGDHTFSVDAAKYSLLNFIEPEVSATHPDWNKDQVRKESLIRFKERMTQDLSYEQKESAHVETAVKWKVVETSPGVKELATEYGGQMVTLKSLWDHTREYAAFVGNIDAYNPEEEKAQYAMEQAFIRGEVHSYVSVLSHPDAVRYVQMWEAGNDGDIVSKQLDLYKTTGRDFTPEEAKTLVQHLANFSQSREGEDVRFADADYAHFMASNQTVAEADIRIIASMQVAEQQALNPAVRDQHSVARAVSKDIGESMNDIRAFVSTIIDKKIEGLREVKKAFTKTKAPEVKLDTTERSLKNNLIHNDKNTFVQEKSKGVYDVDHSFGIKDILSELVISQTILSIAQENPVFSGAALFWLEHRQQKETVNTSFILHKESLMSIDIRIKRLTEKTGALFKKPASFFTHMLRALPFFRYVDRSIRDEDMNKKQIIQEKLEYAVTPGEHVEKANVALIEILVAALEKASHPLKDIAVLFMPHERDAAAKEVVFRAQEKQYIATEASMFGIIYWLLLFHSEKLQKAADNVSESESKGVDVRNRSGESITKPWVLAAIIWYLSMIREAGMSTSQGTSVIQAVGITQTQHAQTIAVFPTSGVIFVAPFMVE